MRYRGIVNPEELLAFASPQVILSTCAWWDSQPHAGPGVLAKTIRAGGTSAQPELSHADIVARSAAYQARVWEWCAKSFPDLCDEQGLASPFAVAAVFRLHCVVGKGRLTVAEHGHLIRAAHAEALAFFDLPREEGAP